MPSALPGGQLLAQVEITSGGQYAFTGTERASANDYAVQTHCTASGGGSLTYQVMAGSKVLISSTVQCPGGTDVTGLAELTGVRNRQVQVSVQVTDATDVTSGWVRIVPVGTPRP